jgi:hypothetical protein
MHALPKAPEIPPMIYQQIDTDRPLTRYSTYESELESNLASSQVFPDWRLRFQIQMLASNGYLILPQILSILPEIRKICERSGPVTSIASIQRFRSLIPWPGMEVRFCVSLHLGGQPLAICLQVGSGFLGLSSAL